MLLLILIALFYLALVIFGSLFIGQMSAPVFALLVYMTPLLLTIILIKQEKQKASAQRLAVIAPSLATLSYVGLSYLSLSSGAWSTFVAANAVANSNVTLNIASNPLSFSQILFVIIVFFGSALATYMMSLTNFSTRGVSHA